MNFMKIPYRTAHLMKKSTLNLLKLPVPPTLTGAGMVHRFPEIISLCDVHKLLIVTGTFAEASGILKKLTDALHASQIDFALFDQINHEPCFEDIYNGLDVYYSNQCDGIIALGGGSCIDSAKLIAAKVTNDKPIPKMTGLFKLSHRLPPLFAIPTTAGSGAEATISACVTDNSYHEKYEIADPKMVPLAVLLDAEMMLGLSQRQRIDQGLAAFATATEAYMSLYDTSFIREKASAAVRTIDQSIETAVAGSSQLSSLQMLAQAAFDAGLASARVGGGYITAAATILSAWYDMPYSTVAAILLPGFLEASLPEAERSFADLALVCGLGEPMDSHEILAHRWISHVKQRQQRFSVPDKISVLHQEDIPELSNRIIKKVNAHYPVPHLLTAETCCLLLSDYLEI